MSADGGVELHAGDAGGEVEARIERVDEENVAMGTAGRRAGSAVTDSAEVVDALRCAGRQTHLR